MGFTLRIIRATSAPAAMPRRADAAQTGGQQQAIQAVRLQQQQQQQQEEQQEQEEEEEAAELQWSVVSQEKTLKVKYVCVYSS